MNDTIIGHEGVARLHEEAGNHLMAAVHRLTGEQATSVLIAFAGWDPARLVDELRRVGTKVPDPLVDHNQTSDDASHKGTGGAS